MTSGHLGRGLSPACHDFNPSRLFSISGRRPSAPEDSVSSPRGPPQARTSAAAQLQRWLVSLLRLCTGLLHCRRELAFFLRCRMGSISSISIETKWDRSHKHSLRMVVVRRRSRPVAVSASTDGSHVCPPVTPCPVPLFTSCPDGQSEAGADEWWQSVLAPAVDGPLAASGASSAQHQVPRSRLQKTNIRASG